MIYFLRKNRQNPSYICKRRPLTRQNRKKELNSVSTSSMDDDKKLKEIKIHESAKKSIVKVLNEPHHRAPIVSSDMTSSDASVEAGLDVHGNHHSKLCSVVDKLQDHEW